MRERHASRIRRIVLLTTMSMFLVVGGLIESKHFRAVRHDSEAQRRDDALKKYQLDAALLRKKSRTKRPQRPLPVASSRSSLFLTDDSAVITMVGGDRSERHCDPESNHGQGQAG